MVFWYRLCSSSHPAALATRWGARCKSCYFPYQNKYACFVSVFKIVSPFAAAILHHVLLFCRFMDKTIKVPASVDPLLSIPFYVFVWLCSRCLVCARAWLLCCGSWLPSWVWHLNDSPWIQDILKLMQQPILHLRWISKFTGILSSLVFGLTHLTMGWSWWQSHAQPLKSAYYNSTKRLKISYWIGLILHSLKFFIDSTKSHRKEVLFHFISS